MKKRIYTAPEAEILEMKAEKGFAQTVEPGAGSIEDMYDDGSEHPWS